VIESYILCLSYIFKWDVKTQNIFNYIFKLYCTFTWMYS